MTVSMPSSASSVTRKRSQSPAPRTADAPILYHDPQTQRWPYKKMATRRIIHQFTIDYLAFLLGISVALVACSTVSGPPLNDSAAEPRSSTDQKRGLDPESSQTEMPRPPRPGPSGGAESSRGQRVVEIARKQIGTPYRFGGTSPSGFDCSGLVRYVYAQVGVSLPHNAAKQYRYGSPIPRDRLEPGDLVFFDRLRHSGIYIGGGRFIHARQTGKRVSIARLDDEWYAENWVGARRL